MNKTDKNSTPLKELFETGAHYGYTNRRRHPSMKPFIFGSKNNVGLIDLEKTAEALDKVLDFVKELGKGGKQIFFVGSKAEAKQIVRETAEGLNQPFVTERWIGGTLTNFPEIKKRVKRLEKLEAEKEKGEFSVYTKKEQLLINREMEKLKMYFDGVRTLLPKPDALFIIDPKQESIARKEATQQNIPIIALMNIDCDLSQVAYPIPGNDSSKATIEYVIAKVRAAYEAGKKEGE